MLHLYKTLWKRFCLKLEFNLQFLVFSILYSFQYNVRSVFGYFCIMSDKSMQFKLYNLKSQCLYPQISIHHEAYIMILVCWNHSLSNVFQTSSSLRVCTVLLSLPFSSLYRHLMVEFKLSAFLHLYFWVLRLLQLHVG